MKKITISLISIAILTSCISQKQQYHEKLKTYMYIPEANLIAHFGAPNSIQQINPTTKVISFNTKKFDKQLYSDFGFKVQSNKNYIDTTRSTVISDVMPYTHTIIDPEVKNEVFYKKCTTNFVLTNGVVTDFAFQGDGCGRN